MRIRSAAVFAAGVLALAAGITLTTRAAWTDEEPLAAGSLTGGRVSLLVGAGTTHVEALTFSSLSGSNLGPGSTRQAPLTATNDGNVALRYRRSAVSFGALEGHASLTSTRVASEAACPPVGPATGLSGDMTSPRTLAPGEAEVWCIRVTLGDAPPQGLTAVPVILTISAEQARHAS